MKRKEAEAFVKANGGAIGSANKKLSFLVSNDPNSSSSKTKKANDLGIPIISESEFMKMAGLDMPKVEESEPVIVEEQDKDILTDINLL